MRHHVKITRLKQDDLGSMGELFRVELDPFSPPCYMSGDEILSMTSEMRATVYASRREQQ